MKYRSEPEFFTFFTNEKLVKVHEINATENRQKVRDRKYFATQYLQHLQVTEVLVVKL